MSAMLRLSCWVLAWAVLLIEGGTATAEAANRYVVIAADPPSAILLLGRVFKIDDQVEVPAGALLTLLGDDGTLVTVGGPERLVVTAEPESNKAESVRTRASFEKISELLLGSSDDAEVLGGRRSVGQSMDGKNLIEPWVLHIGRSGNACVNGSPVELYRAKDLSETPVIIRTNRKDKAARTVWRDGQTKLSLSSLALDNINLLEVKLGDEITVFNIHVLPAEIKPDRAIDVMAWMLERGCNLQAKAYARWLSVN